MKSSLLFKTILPLLILVELFSVLPIRNAPKHPSPYPYLSGIIHVHSYYSDGGGTPDEIMDAANGAGIDFVILTDHNNTNAREKHEGRRGNSDLFVEMEASTPGGHTISFASESAAKKLSDREIVDLSFKHFNGTETKDGFFVAIAHPSNIKNPWNSLDHYPEGIEAVNFDSLWQRSLDSSVLSFLVTSLIYPFNAYLTSLRIFDIYPKDLTVWDAMSQLPGPHFAYLAHDTHAKLKLNERWALRWPNYEETFRLASNIVILKNPPPADFQTRKSVIYKAIRQGNLAFTFNRIFPFSGNDARIECDNERVRAGDSLALNNRKCNAVVELPPSFPHSAVIKILRNGENFLETSTRQSINSFPITQPGTYRVEVWVQTHTLFRILLRRDDPYVFYNPIHIL